MLVGEVNANFSGQSGVMWSVQQILMAINFGFLDWKSKSYGLNRLHNNCDPWYLATFCCWLIH